MLKSTRFCDFSAQEQILFDDLVGAVLAFG